MLTELDDSLWHQLPTTFDHVGTSDPRFFDRYWFAVYSPDGSAALQFTMGVYRNMNVLDAACVVTLDGKQHNLRCSRTLGRVNATVCGPLRVEAVTPLQAFALSLDGAEHGMHGTIHWTGIAPPDEEAPHFRRSNARVVEDYQRFNQIGSAHGGLTVNGTELVIENWWACRDHSWGVRPRMGIPEPQTGLRAGLEERGYTMAFLFFSTESLVGSLLLSRHEGEPTYVSGSVTHVHQKKTYHAVSMGLQPVLYTNTRRFRQVQLEVTLEDGHTLSMLCRSSGSSIAMQGLGYSGGYQDGKGLGVWRGDLTIERDIWDVSDAATIVYPDGSRNQHWHRIQPVEIEGGFDGSAGRGSGSMTLILSGRIPSLGLG
jgi:hypothetical protein